MIDWVFDSVDPVRPEWTPEQTLAISILLDARDTGDLVWVNRGDLDDYIFGFVQICDTLNLDAERVRKYLNATVTQGKIPRWTRRLNVPEDLNATHEFETRDHCNECHERYWSVYRVMKREARIKKK